MPDVAVILLIAAAETDAFLSFLACDVGLLLQSCCCDSVYVLSGLGSY